MKIKILKIVLYIAGIICIIYPLYSRYLSYKNQTEAVYEYKEEIENTDEDEIQDKLQKAEEYNKTSSTSTTVVGADTLDTASQTTTISTYSFLEVGEMIGYITIPKISLELPIYEGVTQNNLQKGVAHMENTSLPNGDLSTHAVLAGHTGLSNAELFDRIDELEIGDTFYITYYTVSNKYEVVNISIVLPDDTSELKVEDGKCLVTLVTCTPKTVNTHRLLVTAQKVENDSNTEDDSLQESDDTQVSVTSDENSYSEIELIIQYIIKNWILFLIIFIFFFLIIIYSILQRKKNKKQKSEM